MIFKEFNSVKYQNIPKYLQENFEDYYDTLKIFLAHGSGDGRGDWFGFGYGRDYLKIQETLRGNGYNYGEFKFSSGNENGSGGEYFDKN